MDDFFRRLIIAAIESFPIEESKKAAILQKILSNSKNENKKG